MPGFFVRMLVSMMGLTLASLAVPGVEIEGFDTLLGAALLLGIANAIVRPILVVLTFPITIVTLGLFLFVVNASMLWLVASFLRDFHLSGFPSAIVASIVISLTSWFASWYVGPKGRIEIVVRRD